MHTMSATNKTLELSSLFADVFANSWRDFIDQKCRRLPASTGNRAMMK
jgi:hypothetical protein